MDRSPHESHRLALEERRALGRSAREHVPRSAHADWTPPKKRAAPLALLRADDGQRLEFLVPIRHDRMRASALAFYRGTAGIMAADLKSSPVSGLGVQLCGDAHLSNFGLYASPERSLLFDLNDFDETLPGPWEWDIKRLATSMVLAARHNGFANGDARAAASACVRSYREALRDFAERSWLEIWYAKLDAERLAPLLATDEQLAQLDKAIEKARRRTSHQALLKLTEEVAGKRRIISNPPLIVPLRDAHAWVDDRGLEPRVRDLFGRYPESLASDRRHLLGRYEVVDIAHKVVGVGSVGRRCLIVLLKGRDWDDPLILQMKEAGESVLAKHGGLAPSKYAHAGRRVVEGQRLMQAASDIFLGWNETTDGRDYYWRQLRDMKGSIEVETLSPEGLASYGQVCGWALSRAHARSGDPVAIAAYLGKSDAFDKALTRFAERYADQAQEDYAEYLAAIEAGAISVASSSEEED